MRPNVRTVCGGAALLAALTLPSLFAASAHAQTGTPVVPPGYGTSSPTVSGTVTVTAPGVGPAQNVVVTAPPRVPTGHYETRTSERSVRALWLPGLIALPVSWLLTWTISSTGLPTSSGGIAFSFVPIVGPWLMLTEPINGYEGFAVTMGLVQGTAAILLILGLSLTETVEQQVWVADLGEGRRLAFNAAPSPTGAFSTATLSF